MATTVSDSTGEVRVTLSATPGNSTKFNLPTWAVRVFIHNDPSTTSVIKISSSGTDDGAIGSHYVRVQSDGNVSFAIRRSRNRYDSPSLYIASDTASTVVYLRAEEV